MIRLPNLERQICEARTFVERIRVTSDHWGRIDVLCDVKGQFIILSFYCTTPPFPVAFKASLSTNA